MTNYNRVARERSLYLLYARVMRWIGLLFLRDDLREEFRYRMDLAIEAKLQEYNEQLRQWN